MCIFCDFLWPEVQPHSDDSQMHVTAPCSARVLDQARPTNVVHFLVTVLVNWTKTLYTLVRTQHDLFVGMSLARKFYIDAFFLPPQQL